MAPQVRKWGAISWTKWRHPSDTTKHPGVLLFKRHWQPLRSGLACGPSIQRAWISLQLLPRSISRRLTGMSYRRVFEVRKIYNSWINRVIEKFYLVEFAGIFESQSLQEVQNAEFDWTWLLWMPLTVAIAAVGFAWEYATWILNDGLHCYMHLVL